MLTGMRKKKSANYMFLNTMAGLFQEILTFCLITKEKPVSIELIHNLFGGINMEYPAVEIRDSVECFQFCCGDLIKKLQATKFNIEFFEDRTTSDANVIVAVVKKPKKGGGFQIAVWCVVRMTIFTTPKVGFCRYFDLTGQSCFVFFSYTITFSPKYLWHNLTKTLTLMTVYSRSFLLIQTRRNLGAKLEFKSIQPSCQH